MTEAHLVAQPISVSDAGDGVFVARIDVGPLGLFGRDDAPKLFEFIEWAHRDPEVKAVVFTGAHPTRFISHADLGWLQEDGSVIPPVGRAVTGAVMRIAHLLGRTALTRRIAAKTPLTGAIQLDRMHRTLTLMTTSSTIFVAALNGSTLGMGAELSWSCDLRLMADGGHFIGHLEVLLGFPPGAGGTQRLARLIGGHRALLAMLEGRPYAAAEALDIGMIDEIVPADQLIERAVERARYLSARPTAAVGAIKRAVNVGSSQSIEEGLHTESAEFLASLPQPRAQDIMLAYIRATAEGGELPIYRTGGYDAALAHGSADVAVREGR